MQWASSTVIRLTFMWPSFLRNSSEESLSGDTYSIFTPPKMAFSSVAMTSACIMPEYTAAALMPLLRRLSTWSFIKAMSGVITKHTPGIDRAGTWNVTDLPPPVGISPRVSLPAQTLSIISRCMPRKSS